MKLGSTEVQTRKVLAIAALGIAGFCSAAACGTAVQASSQPRPPSAAATDSTGLARDIARIAVGSGGLAALDNGDGQAALAYCDPSTVSGRPTSAPRCPLPVGSITLTDRSGDRQSP